MDYKNIGYIETKSLFDDLESRKHTEQIKRYIENIDNLILTNYLSFYYFKDGKLIETLNIVSNSDFRKKEFLIHSIKISNFKSILTNFYLFEYPQIKDAAELAKM